MPCLTWFLKFHMPITCEKSFDMDSTKFEFVISGSPHILNSIHQSKKRCSDGSKREENRQCSLYIESYYRRNKGF